MRISRSRRIHRFIAVAAGLGFAAMTLGIIARLHLAHEGPEHHEDRCPICVQISLVQKQALIHWGPPQVQVLLPIGLRDVSLVTPVIRPLSAILYPRAPPC